MGGRWGSECDCGLYRLSPYRLFPFSVEEGVESYRAPRGNFPKIPFVIKGFWSVQKVCSARLRPFFAPNLASVREHGKMAICLREVASGLRSRSYFGGVGLAGMEPRAC